MRFYKIVRFDGNGGFTVYGVYSTNGIINRLLGKKWVMVAGGLSNVHDAKKWIVNTEYSHRTTKVVYRTPF